uniref:Uncharacterized protein n=1 Tax=Trichobilharzia regenti TaxID=157069 RepID=A0AA85JVE6_TRIRE|nr:unnamed protein product [Trichobilharzia regenti]
MDIFSQGRVGSAGRNSPIDSENSLYTIRSKDYTTSCQPSAMLSITPRNMKLLCTNNDIMSSLESLDDTYFITKLNHLINAPLLQTSNDINLEDNNIPHGAYYYATMLEADHENDIFTVSFCYYENTEKKSSEDLYQINSEFRVCVKDELNKAAALSRKESFVITHQCTEQEDYGDENEICELSVHDEGTKWMKEISSYLHQVSLESIASHNKTRELNVVKPTGPELLEFSSHENNSESAKKTSGSSKLPLVNTSNIRKQLNDLQVHPLLMSWFICGYQTGFYEVYNMHS